MTLMQSISTATGGSPSSPKKWNLLLESMAVLEEMNSKKKSVLSKKESKSYLEYYNKALTTSLSRKKIKGRLLDFKSINNKSCHVMLRSLRKLKK